MAGQITANTLAELRKILDTTLFNAKHCNTTPIELILIYLNKIIKYDERSCEDEARDDGSVISRECHWYTVRRVFGAECMREN